MAYAALSGETVSISQIAGSKIQMEGYICVPAFHPAAALYGDQAKIVESIKQSIKYAIEIAGGG